MVVTWEQHYTSEEMPPEWMWPFPEELNLWFEDVKAARDERMAGGGKDDDDEGEMVENDLAPPRPTAR